MDTRLRQIDGKRWYNAAVSIGPGFPQGDYVLTTTPSGKWPPTTQSYNPTVSCALRCHSYNATTWLSGRITATDASYPPLAHGPVEIRLQIRNSYSDLRLGYGAS